MDFFVSPGFTIFLLVAILALAGWATNQHITLRKVQKQREALMLKGDQVGDFNLESLLNEHTEGLANHQEDLEMIYKILEKLNSMAAASIQKIGVIRFNPFASSGEGGNQSFAVALLDSANNGIVISSLFARDESRIYTKAITGGKSEHHLSKEEQEAIQKAINTKE